MSYQKDRQLSSTTSRHITKYLFGDKELEPSQYLDMRTDMPTTNLMRSIAHYRIFDECYKSKAANMIANILERLVISRSREGRKEGVTIMSQPQGKEQVLMLGTEEPAVVIEK